MHAAVVIGVDKVTRDLPSLTAAAKGANDVAEWLRRSDYTVELLTDETSAVDRTTIFRTVAKFVEAGNVERLLIYFAGHGFLRGTLEESWLLSGASDDPGDAVNLHTSGVLARYCGIPEIIFISDACRTAPGRIDHAAISGAPIFPNRTSGGNSSEIDFYYGTHPGDPALEKRSKDGKRAHGLFTASLIEAHRDAPDEALLRIGDREYVRNRWLRSVLRDRVDERAQSISLALTQKPDVQVQIDNGYIALNERGDTADGGGPPPSEFDLKWAAPPILVRKSLGWEGSAPSLIDEGARTDEEFVNRLTNVMPQTSRGPGGELFVAAGASLSCRGDSIKDIGPSLGQTAQLVNGQRVVFDLDAGLPQQVAIRFEDGSGMVIPIMEGYDCEIVRREGSTISLSYSWREEQDPNISSLRAEVLSAASLGWLKRDAESISAFADRIRQAKRYDPSLGLVAALAYANVGDFKGARSVRDYLREDLGIDLFDTWLLGGGTPDERKVPFVPMLSQTWSFAEVLEAGLDDSLRALPRVPGFWTVFQPQAMSELMELVPHTFNQPVY